MPSLEELNQKMDQMLRKNQSEKDRAVKQLQQEIDSLRSELAELRDLLKEYLVEEITYAK